MRRFLTALSVALALVVPAIAQAFTAGNIVVYQDGTGGFIKDSGVPITALRTTLTGAQDYFVRTDGLDSNTGLTNSASAPNGAFLTVQHCLNVIAYTLDTAGFNVKCRVQGGTYTANIIVPGSFVGYNGSGFEQVMVLGENGTVTLTSPNTGAAIFATKSGAPWAFENIVVTNPAANGVEIEADDYAFLALKTVTFGATGSGGIKLQSLLNSQVLLISSTFQLVGNSGVAFYMVNTGKITAQPSTVFNVSGAQTYATAVVFVDPTSQFFNQLTSFTGSTPTGPAYSLAAGGYIYDPTLIAGSVAGTAGGLTGTVTVRKGGGSTDCGLVYVNGILTSTTC